VTLCTKGRPVEGAPLPRVKELSVPKRFGIYISLVYVVLAWALNTVLAKQAFDIMNPLAFTFLRFLVMTPLAFLMVRAAGQRIHIDRRDWLMLLAAGACGFGVYQYLWVIGLKYTTPFASSLLGSLAPIFTLAIVAAFGHERVRSGRWLGAAIALAGIAIFEGAFTGHAQVKLGDVLTFFAAVVFAIYNVLNKPLLERYTPLELLAITMTIGTIMLAPAGIPITLHTNLVGLPWALWWRLIYATFFPVLLTYPVWGWGISKLGAGKASIFSFLVPILTGVLSVPLIHEQFQSYEVTGALVTLGGMLISYLFGKVSFSEIWGQRT
jgi:drug/metabolite transporter (DMT)-like permease